MRLVEVIAGTSDGIGSEFVSRSSRSRSVAWPRMREVSVVRVPGGRLLDTVVIERKVTITVNGGFPIVLHASPAHLEELATGHLFACGLISRAHDISRLTVNGLRVEVELNSGPSSSEHTDAKLTIRSRELIAWMETLISGARIHSRTGGTHCAAIASGGKIVIAREDVGRHNAIDKAIGAALLAGMDGSGVVLMSTGRVNRETAAKAAAFGVPVMASRSAPTDAGLRLLSEAGVTLVSFIRKNRVNVYTHQWRISDYNQEG